MMLHFTLTVILFLSAVVVTHDFLVGAGLPGGELEVLPSDDEEEEERQHEELHVPHRHQEDLRRQSTGPAFTNDLSETKHPVDLSRA